ncbi:hypothetical protein J3F83DRAFT_735569 [Trichoderma novae-zelandiae]
MGTSLLSLLSPSALLCSALLCFALLCSATQPLSVCVCFWLGKSLLILPFSPSAPSTLSHHAPGYRPRRVLPCLGWLSSSRQALQ